MIRFARLRAMDRPQPRLWTRPAAPLGLLAREAQLGGYASPAVIVVGEVVALATVREAELRRCWARCA